MRIKIIEVKGPLALYDAEFAVSHVGSVLTIGAGDYKIEGVTYTLLDDETFDFAPLPSNDTYYAGFLVREKATEDIAILVDTVLIGVEEDYIFDEASPYESIEQVFTARYTTDLLALDDLEIRVRHMKGV